MKYKRKTHMKNRTVKKMKVLMIASVASMIDQFNMPNIRLLQRMGCDVHVACNFDEGNTCEADPFHAKNAAKAACDLSPMGLPKKSRFSYKMSESIRTITGTDRPAFL